METNDKLLSEIFNIGRIIREKVSSSCSTDFSQAEIEVLKFLDKNKNTRMRDIANYLHIKPSSATTAIKTLARKGFLKRIGDKNDRRVVYVSLTPKGLKTLQKKYKTVHNAIGKIFAKLSEKDKKTLINIFSKIK
jgi:DNA-binding MarR family transcriptional regulator